MVAQNLQIDETQLRREFNSDLAIQNEFGGNFDNFLAYVRACHEGYVSDRRFAESVAEEVNFSIEAKQQTFDESTATDEQLKEHFAKTQQIQDEFGDVASYLAYVRHDVRKRG